MTDQDKDMRKDTTTEWPDKSQVPGHGTTTQTQPQSGGMGGQPGSSDQGGTAYQGGSPYQGEKVWKGHEHEESGDTSGSSSTQEQDTPR